MNTHSTDFPHITLDNEPLFVLTNAACEDTGHWSPQQLDQIGLDYGEWNGEDYPLTDEEANLISYDCLMTPAGGNLMFGYTALFQCQKWAMPTIEYMKPVDQNDFTEELQTLKELVASYQGRVVIEQEGPEDRVTVLILVPFKVVQEAFGAVQAWKRYLERGIGILSE